MVVVGPHGAGKTSLVRKVLRDRGKVVHVELTNSTNMIVDKIRDGLFLTDTTKFELVDVFKPFLETAGEDKLVVVVELVSQVIDGLVKTQSAEAKKLVDGRYCHVVLVLVDANAFKLESGGREDFLWVGDFTPIEANVFFDKCGIKCGVLRTDNEPSNGPNSTLRQRIFNEVGANPLALRRAANTAGRAALEALAREAANAPESARTAASRSENFIKEQHERAENDVSNLLAQSSYEDTARRPMRLLLLLLLLEEIRDSVSQKDGLFSADELKREHHHALCFNSETGLCQFYSNAHRRAAQAWFGR